MVARRVLYSEKGRTSTMDMTDFRELNIILKSKIVSRRRIINVLQKRIGYRFLQSWISACNITPSSWTTKARSFALLLHPLESFVNRLLPMGIKQSPDFAQEIMEDVLRGIDECGWYYITMLVL